MAEPDKSARSDKVKINKEKEKKKENEGKIQESKDVYPFTR